MSEEAERVDKGVPEGLASSSKPQKSSSEADSVKAPVVVEEGKAAAGKAAAEVGEAREDLALLRMIVSLMEDVAKTMLRVERSISDRFSMLEKKIEEVREDLAGRVESVELKGVSKLEETLEKAVSSLQKGMEIMAIRDLVQKVEDLAVQIREGKVVKPEVPAPKEERKEVPPPAVRRRETVPAKPARGPTPYEEESKREEEERLIKPSDLFRRGY